MKKAIPTLNVRLLNRVKRQILKEPKQFQMDSYFAEAENAEYGDDVPTKIPNCGTAACIAGWTVAISRKESPKKASDIPRYHVSYLATEALRLPEGFKYRLFSDDYWPEPFRTKWKQLTKDKQWTRRAKVAAARIDHFIKTGE